MTKLEELKAAMEDADAADDIAQDAAYNTQVAYLAARRAWSNANAAYEAALDEEITKPDEVQKIWEVLRAVYGNDLQAATVTVLVQDGETDVHFTTITFPLKEKK